MRMCVGGEQGQHKGGNGEKGMKKKKLIHEKTGRVRPKKERGIRGAVPRRGKCCRRTR